MTYLLAGAVIVLLSEASTVPFPPSPAQMLPSLDGTAFPPYRVVFFQGECTANDGPKHINLNKTCFSCFRIPTLLAGLTPGVIHAFAEARRGELTSGFHQYTGSGATSCPDGPDTRLVYKRSADDGATWTPIKVFTQDDGPNGRAEDGTCQSQASPLIDPVTKTLFVGFNLNPGCQGGSDIPNLAKSMDDGLRWSKPYAPIMNLGGGRTGPATEKSGFLVGPTKGLSLKLPSGGVRLLLPGEGGAFGAASIYSDDHGSTWNSNGTGARGEMDWTVCTTGACPIGQKYAMLNRGGAKTSPESCEIQFSADSTTWTKPLSTDNGDVVVGTHHGKPGLVAVPGGFISSQQIMLCTRGLKQNPDNSCGSVGDANYTTRKPSDVVGHGMGLLASKDGVHWKLLRKLWPFGGMYTTIAALTTDAEGGALTYGVIFSAGTLGGAGVGTVYYQNFTFTHADLDGLTARAYLEPDMVV